MRRWLKRIGIAVAALVVVAALPVLWIETQCVAAKQARTAPPSLLAAADRREEVNTYLTYPEWSIVHAYEDLAAVTRRSSESDYPYFGAIGRFWSSLCSISKLASSRGTISGEYKAMLHTIGLSFAGEMGVKGSYEKSIGRLTSWIAGGVKTPEDQFALALAEDYAKFLRQTPWYEYPFGAKLVQFWRETPLMGGNIIRKLERRLALSHEWGVKSIYARLIALGAAAAPAALRIKSVVTGLDAGGIAADPRIKLVEMRDGAAIIETDRYATFTDIMRGIAARGGAFAEIAGNRNIMVTALAPKAEVPAGVAKDAALLFSVPVETRPGWHRLALDVKVPSLTAFMHSLEQSGVVLDHVYDY